MKQHCQIYFAKKKTTVVFFINICVYQFFVDGVIRTDSMICLFVANGSTNTICY